MPSTYVQLPGDLHLRLVNRRTLEHAGPCPFCGGDTHRSDRFRVWLEPGKERYWCRACGEKGPLRRLLGEDRPLPRPALRRPRGQRQIAAPAPAIPHYRALYAAVALWAHANLLDPANPDPLAYLHGRGLDDTTVAHAVLGVTRRDPAAQASPSPAGWSSAAGGSGSTSVPST